jgi:hypothetical protein
MRCDMRDPDIQRDISREADAQEADAHKAFLLNDPTINDDIFSTRHATRYRAKERQAYELYVNSLIRAIPISSLTQETVDAIKEAVAKTW